MIKVDNLYAGYSKEKIIENISFDIKENELVGIVGSNGCGKSTLAKAICNILPHSGNVYINTQAIEEQTIIQAARMISYVPQNSGISIDISVLDVVLMGFNSQLKILEKPSEAMKNRAKEVICLMGLENLANKNYMLLSEGQKQLVILARALVSNALFYVLDEPESSLDFNVRFKIFQTIKQHICEDNRAGLIILHDLLLALNCCDKLLLLKDKKIIDSIDLHNETADSIENKLKNLYKNIKVVKLAETAGNNSLVVLFDSEVV